LSAIFGAIFAGLGLAAAGIGIYRFGSERGKTQAKALEAFDVFIRTQDGIARAQDRQAVAAETNARLIPLLEALHEDREQTSTTLRVISRELRELREYVYEHGLESEVRREKREWAPPSSDS
jgi:uncharacterized protein (DUF58 family)